MVKGKTPRFYRRVANVVERLEAIAAQRTLTDAEKVQLAIARENLQLMERQMVARYRGQKRRTQSTSSPKDLYGGVRSIVSGGLPGLGKKR